MRITKGSLIRLAVSILVLVALLYAWCIGRAAAQELPVDTDGDGCSNAEEIQYGMDPDNPYDFFDVPPKDGAISAGDIAKIVARFGLTEVHPDYYVGFDHRFG